MRITFVLPEANLAGGVRVVAIYAERLRQRGHEVLVVSQPHPEPGLRERLSTLVRQGRWPRVLPGSHLDETEVRHRVLESRRALTDADVPDGDVVIATWWETAEWVWGLSPAKGAKVYFIQGDDTQFYSREQVEERNRILATLRLPMHRITVSNWLARWVRSNGGEAAAVIANAVDTGMFAMRPRTKQEEFRVGFVYSPLHLKGTDVAIEAIRRVRQCGVQVRVQAFGLEEPAGRLPLPAGAEYVVRPEQMAIPDLYRRCDAWLFASRCEGFGLPVLEAMACGTPVIAAPAGAAPELLEGGGGILLRSADAEEMAEAIGRLAAMPEQEWQRLSEAARATAAGHCWDEAAQRFEAELEFALAAQSGVAALSGGEARP